MNSPGYSPCLPIYRWTVSPEQTLLLSCFYPSVKKSDCVPWGTQVLFCNTYQMNCLCSNPYLSVGTQVKSAIPQSKVYIKNMFTHTHSHSPGLAEQGVLHTPKTLLRLPSHVLGSFEGYHTRIKMWKTRWDFLFNRSKEWSQNFTFCVPFFLLP